MVFTYPPQAFATDSPTQAHFRIWVLLPERNNSDTAAAPSAKYIQIYSDISKHPPHPLPRGQDFNFLLYEASAVAPSYLYQICHSCWKEQAFEGWKFGRNGFKFIVPRWCVQRFSIKAKQKDGSNLYSLYCFILYKFYIKSMLYIY